MSKRDLPGCACALLCGLDIVEGFKAVFPMDEETLRWFIENLGYACDSDDLGDIADFLDREGADEFAEIVDDYAESCCPVRGPPKKR